MVVRDLMFKGLRTFREFADAGEGVATNVLSDRLARLEEAGIIARRRDPADARRIVYRLTRKGIDLAPILIEMVIWADRYEETDAPRDTVRAMRADRAAVIADVEQRWTREGAEADDRKRRRRPR